METLTCEQCTKKWKRQPTRGRKPRLCPSCLAAPSSVVSTSSPKTLVSPTAASSKESLSQKREYKFPAPTKWVCPTCKAGVKIGVNLDHPPTHACKKRLRKVFPLDLIRTQEA